MQKLTLNPLASRWPKNEDPLKTCSPQKLVGLFLFVSLLLLPKLAQADSLQGCVSSAPNSLLLFNEGDRQTYDLIGETNPVKAGQRVKVSGKKKKDTSGKRYFLVEKLSKTYGACKVGPATP
jgi:hypothetical protein